MRETFCFVVMPFRPELNYFFLFIQRYLEEKYKTDQDNMDRYEAQLLEAKFAQLLEDLKKENNPIISRQIELKIHKLANELPTSTNILSASELIESIQREKRMQSHRR